MSSLAGLTVGLPQYLRFDLAWQDEIIQPAALGNQTNTTRVPGEYWVRILSITWSYTTSAAVGIRYPSLQIFDLDSRRLFSSPAVAGQNPSTSNTYYWYLGGGGSSGVIDQPQITGLPPIFLQSGWAFGMIAINGILADSFGAATYFVEKIPTGPARREVSVPSVLPLDLAGLGSF